MNEWKKREILSILNMIMLDTKEDTHAFEGKPFNGATMGEYMGYHAASIVALANLMKQIVEDIETKEE